MLSIERQHAGLAIREACLLGLPSHRSSGKVRVAEVVRRLRLSNAAFAALTPAEVKAEMRAVFPITRNARKGVSVFKVSQASAQRYLDSNAMLARPLEVARSCRIGNAVRISLEVRHIVPPTSRKGRLTWEEESRGLKWRRVLAFVDGVDAEIVSLTVPQLTNERLICVPRQAVVLDIGSEVRPGAWLIARAAVRSTMRDEFRMREFAVAPDPDPDDGLS
jgi:hypothetical protein